MSWPQATDFAEAVQNLSVNFRDPDIRIGETATNALGLPMSRTGNFAAVFQVRSPSGAQNWAVKCFTRQVPGLEERYRHIDAHLHGHRLPFMVDFRYLPDDVLVRGQRYPCLKMDWVEGLRLDEFLTDCLTQPNYRSTLRKLCDMWLRMARMLREANVGHGDLQHGNVLLVPVPDKEAYNLKLIDYDGMYVPELADRPPGEVGHPAYQHPQRLIQGGYGPEIDQFAHLVIYTTLRCLIVGGRGLWVRYYDGDRLLAGPQDLAAPEDSPVFRILWQIPEPEVQSLVGPLILAAQGPGLDELMMDSRVVPLTEAQRGQVEELMSTGAPWSREATRIVAAPTKTSLQTGGSETPPSAGSQDKPTQTTFTKESTIETFAPSDGATPQRPPRLPGKRETVTSMAEETVATAEFDPSRTRRLGTKIRSAGAGSVRWIDRVLQRMAGRENVVLHNFLRCIAVVMCLALPVLGVISVSRFATIVAENTSTVWRSLDTKIRDGSGAIENDESDGKPASDAETNPPDDGTVEDENEAGDEETDGTEAPDETRSQPPLAVAPFDAPQAAQHQRAWAEYLGVAKEITNSIGVKLVLIPPGEFLMGSPENEENRSPDEQQHQVRITKPFYLGVYEVTQEQWESVMGDNPSHFKWRKNPVENVSWDDCQAFLDKLKEKSWDGRGKFSLPTEAQWEYACRAGTTTRYNFGDDEASVGEYASYLDNSNRRTHPVGEKKPNAWGVYDMHGNVWEWCQDWYASGYYKASPVDDPLEPSPGSLRVIRGGSWHLGARFCRAAYRFRGVPRRRDIGLGFRVAAVPPSKSSQEQASRRATPPAEPPDPESLAPKVGMERGPKSQGEEASVEPPPTTIRKAPASPFRIMVTEKIRFDRRGVQPWVAFNPNGSLAFTMLSPGVCTVWETATGEKRNELNIHQPSGTSVAFAPDGSRVVIAGMRRTGARTTDGIANVWDMTTGRKLTTILWKGWVITSVAFTPDGRKVIAGSNGPTALWDASSGRRGRNLPDADDTIVSIACSPDGKKVLAGCRKDSAILWDASSLEKLHVFQGHNGPVSAVAFSRDGLQLLTGEGYDSRRSTDDVTVFGGKTNGAVILWDTDSGRELRRFAGPQAAFALSSDNAQVLVGSQLYDASNGELIAILGAASPVYPVPGMASVAFSPDGREVLIATFNGVYSGTIAGEP